MGRGVRRRRWGFVGLVVAAAGCLALALLQVIEPLFFASRPLGPRMAAGASWGVLALLLGALAWWAWRRPTAKPSVAPDRRPPQRSRGGRVLQRAAAGEFGVRRQTWEDVGPVQWLRRNAVGVLGLALAVVAIAAGAEAYRTGDERDEQARAILRRLERGETDLAEQHRRSVAALSGYADAVRSVAYLFVGLAAAAEVLHASRSRPSLWLTGVVAVLAVGAVVLAYESRAEPVAAADRRGMIAFSVV